MTATFKKLENFKKALKPNLDSVEKKAAIILDSSFVSTSQKTILREIEMVKWLRPNLKKFFYSICIDFLKKENLTNEFLREVCFEYLQLNGFVLHQYLMFRYDDVAFSRVNILVTRIGYDGKVNNDSHDHSRSEKALSQLRRRHNLRK